MKTPATLDQMLDFWNERDLSKLRARMEAVLAPEVEFIDPTIVTRGLDEFEANVRDFRSKYPEATIHKTSGIAKVWFVA
jgi:SnoaL-like domain